MARYEILKFYKGEFILNLGRPHLLLVGVEKDDELFLETYQWLEDLEGNHTHDGSKVRTAVQKGIFDNIEELMTYLGLEEAENKLYTQAIKEQMKNKNHSDTPIKIQLKETPQTSFLLHMWSKAPKELDWISVNTDSQNLRNDISLYQGIAMDIKPLK